MRNKLIMIVVSFVLVVGLVGCRSAVGTEGVQTEGTDGAETSPATAEPVTDDDSSANQTALRALSATVKEHDTDLSFDETDTVIELTGAAATVSGPGATVADKVVTITAAGTYVVSGRWDDGQIVIAATNADKVHLVLNGADITNTTGAAIYASQCDKLIVTLVEGTENSLTDGSSDYVYTDLANEEPNAALFSKDDLTINGTGSLTVNAGFNNGIGTKDDLLVVSGNIAIEAANHGLRGNDSVTVLDGSFTIVSGNDGISANNSEDASLGYILLEDGDFTITTSGGYPGQSIKVNERQMDGKGINASGCLKINGGTFTISSYDDAIRSDLALAINGGTFCMEAGATGIQALAVEIGGGTIDILNSYEGMEGENDITVNGGTLTINAGDDGINISATTGSFNFNGGDITITAVADGIDSNGDIHQSGGTATITITGMNGGGNAAIDYDGTFTRTGGTMVDADGNELSTDKIGMGGRGNREREIY